MLLVKLRIARMNVTDVDGLRFLPDEEFEIAEIQIPRYSEEYDKSICTKDGKMNVYLIPRNSRNRNSILLTSSYDDKDQRMKINDLFDVLNTVGNLYLLGQHTGNLTLDCAVHTIFDKYGHPKEAYFIGFGNLYYTDPVKCVTANFTVVRRHEVSNYRITFNENTMFYIKDDVLTVNTDGAVTEIDITNMPQTSVHKLMNTVIIAKEAAKNGLEDYSKYASTVITVE
jgi:hypothetical protein